MEAVGDLRNWIASRTAGVSRLLFHAHASAYDAAGAIRAGQTTSAAYAARDVVLIGLSIHSLVSGRGEIDWGAPPDDAGFDPFDGVDEALVAEGFAIVAATFDHEDGEAWLASLWAFLGNAEAALGLGDPLPDVRQAEGQFAALARARPYIEIATELGISINSVITEYAFD